MRIIDKMHDFYDYMQDSTDTLVFDRRGSFLLTKECVCSYLRFMRYHGGESKFRFVLMQCGATFWLMLFTVTKDDHYKDTVIDYDIEVLKMWKNYNKPNKLLNISIVAFRNDYKFYDHKTRDFDEIIIKNNVNDLREAIDRNDYEDIYEISYSRNHEVPLLKASGIGSVVDPQEIFCAIEEYFSIEKTKSETTEAKGATNDDKIIMHGFDTKTSFRGKQIV